MIMSNSTIDTLSIYVGTLGMSIGPLLQARFAMADHTCSTLAFVRRLLCADSPLGAPASNLPPWRSNVVHEGSSRHLGFIVSADKVSQFSVNDGGRVRAFTCKWSQIVPRRLVPDRHIPVASEM